MMRTTFLPSALMSSTSKLSLMKLQAKLAEAQKEVASGRLADVGLSLGSQTGQTVSLRQQLTRLQTITDTNAVAKTRLDASQAALDGIAKNAQQFLDQLLAMRDSATGADTIPSLAKSGLAAFTDAVNSTVDGSYLFSGINADVKPLDDYFQSPASGAQNAVAGAFQSAFGMAPTDVGVAGISAADMQSFLDGPFAGLFDDAGWSTDWSSASEQNARSRISTSELVDTSTNANAPAFRKLAQAFVMVADLGTQSLDTDTCKTVIDQATKLVGEAIGGFTALQADLGSAQARVKSADERMSIQIDIITTHIGALESVDPTEASTKVTSLLNQIEAAYAMTARIQQLSLLNYLPVA
jgi:flagellar hook-associated protein 3 FlgL